MGKGDEMHAIGSVIAIQENKFVVCGYNPYEREDGSVGFGYVLVPYPLGFVNVDSLSLVDVERAYPVVHEGYKNEAAEEADQVLEAARESSKNLTMAEFQALQDEAAAEIQEALEASDEEVE